MNEKKSKIQRRTLVLPVYDIQQQLGYVKQVCEQSNFDADRLISFILADFINPIEIRVRQGVDLKTCFFSYLEHVQKSAKELKEWLDQNPQKDQKK